MNEKEGEEFFIKKKHVNCASANSSKSEISVCECNI